MPDERSSSATGLCIPAAVFILWVFTLSRIVIIAAMAVSPWVIPAAATPGQWNLEDPLLRPLFRWDATWYLSIARHGYTYNGNPAQAQNVVFLPLYPLTCRLCQLGTGLSIPWCAVLLSHLAFLVALAVLYILTTRELGSAVARRAVLLLAFFPASLSFSTMYTEAFYLTFSLLAFTAFRQRHWLRGGLWAGLASATRVPGILLVLPLLCEALPHLDECRRRWRVLLASGLAGSGLVAFMGYEWLAFGDPLANFRVQGQAWGRRWGWPDESLVRGLLKTERHCGLRPIQCLDGSAVPRTGRGPTALPADQLRSVYWGQHCDGHVYESRH